MQISENSKSLYNVGVNNILKNEYRSLASLSYLEQKLEIC
uniref:Uncharacterized protein n=1 Tax=Romanomermis culicivorax TaxID=13658 RepID=A0A915KH46_ROMCU